GASTATSLSKSVPKAPEDLTDIYLLVVLGANAQSSGEASLADVPSHRRRLRTTSERLVRSQGNRERGSTRPLATAEACLLWPRKEGAWSVPGCGVEASMKVSALVFACHLA
ncbi:unnamed protein product, partial [Ectocarpus sp. 12 AP-2014]